MLKPSLFRSQARWLGPLWVLAFCSTGPAAFGQQVPPAPAGTPLPRSTASDHLDLSVGGGVVFGPRPYVGAHSAVIPIPVVNVRYKRVFLEGIRGGLHVVRAGQLTGNAFLQANFAGLESSDSAFLDGMENRRMSADGGAELVYRARPVGFRVAVLSDVLGRNNGQEVSVQALTGAPLGRKAFLLAGIGPRWLSANRVNYNYGVRPSEARADRPAYAPGASWNWDVSVGVNYRPWPRWSFFALVSRQAFGSPIEGSPIVGQPAAYSFISSLAYSIR